MDRIFLSFRCFLTRVFSFFAYALLFLSPRLVFAGDESPVSQGLGYIINTMYGPTGIAIATIAVMAVGLFCFFGRLEWKYLLQTVGGVAIVFGAGAIVSGIQYLVHK